MIFVRCYHCECMPSASKSGLCDHKHCQDSLFTSASVRHLWPWRYFFNSQKEESHLVPRQGCMTDVYDTPIQTATTRLLSAGLCGRGVMVPFCIRPPLNVTELHDTSQHRLSSHTPPTPQAALLQNPTAWLPSPYQQRVTPGLTVSVCHHSFQELSGSKVGQPIYVTCNDIAQKAVFHIHASLPIRKRSLRSMFSGHTHTSLHQATQISCSCSWLTTVSCTTPSAKPKCIKVWCKATRLFLWISSSITVVSCSTLKVLVCYVYHH